MNKYIVGPLNSSFFESAVELSYDNYLVERAKVTSLNETLNKDYFSHQLEPLFSQGTGRMVFEDSLLVGFIAFEHAGRERAVSPLYGYGVSHENRGLISNQLFQEVAAELCKSLIQSIRVNVYAHDTDVLWMYIMSAFSMDVTDVIRVTETPIEARTLDMFTFREVHRDELFRYKEEIIELYRSLINHLRVSPVFYPCLEFLPIENRFDDFLSDNIRIFTVFDKDTLVGMIDAEPCDKYARP